MVRFKVDCVFKKGTDVLFNSSFYGKAWTPYGMYKKSKKYIDDKINQWSDCDYIKINFKIGWR